MAYLPTIVLVILAFLLPGIFRSEPAELIPVMPETAPAKTVALSVSADEILTVLEDCTGYAGTAGSSLKQAVAVCKIVSFAEERRLADIPSAELDKAFSIALARLDETRREELPTNLKGISSLVERARADWDSVSGLFESAGVEEEAAALLSSDEAYAHFLAFSIQLAHQLPQ